MLNNCFYCHRQPYETTPDHWHYCNDCVKVCTVCKELKGLWAFNFDYKSEEYKRWKASDCYGIMNASGFTEECGSCIGKLTDSLIVKKTPVKIGVEITSEAMLRIMREATVDKR
jgi:hypothetical protein